jgi:hypothetical protein
MSCLWSLTVSSRHVVTKVCAAALGSLCNYLVVLCVSSTHIVSWCEKVRRTDCIIYWSGLVEGHMCLSGVRGKGTPIPMKQGRTGLPQEHGFKIPLLSSGLGPNLLCVKYFLIWMCKSKERDSNYSSILFWMGGRSQNRFRWRWRVEKVDLTKYYVFVFCSV